MKQKCIKCKRDFPLQELKMNSSTKTPYRQCKECHSKGLHETYLRKKNEREFMNQFFGFEVFFEDKKQ